MPTPSSASSRSMASARSTHAPSTELCSSRSTPAQTPSLLRPVAAAIVATLTSTFLLGTAAAASGAGSTDARANAAETSAQEFEPQVGQPGKDVVWVPTPQALVDTMLDLAELTADDYLVDLGSGDGRTVITAAKRGARAHGIEYNPNMVELARRNAQQEGVSDRATFEQGDLFEKDFSNADVITLFLLPSLNERLRPILLEMRPGVRVVSNSFGMGAWEPNRRANVDGSECRSWCSALMWVVPARVEGVWELDGKTLELAQDFQKVSGTYDGHPITDGRLNGADIVFSVNGVEYKGTVDGKVMSGERSGGDNSRWHAIAKQTAVAGS